VNGVGEGATGKGVATGKLGEGGERIVEGNFDPALGASL